ncbi:MAG: COX15/CtaA family protein [Betaproteobacteria bacterium]|nr:COX15/CtaA family protein [Betaproteobacteria bacterium]
MDGNTRTGIAAWLLACCALVFAMVVVGGVTRLTHSGLSIVEWQPIVGTIPPLSEAQWQETFAKYRQTPEYQKVNAGMSLDEFKGIFWLEYFHRLLGRVTGIAFLVPLLYFLARGRLEARLAWKLGAVFLLGALQGAMGWYMVASGLVDDPRVSQYRLTAHLALAFVIYGAMLWLALGLLIPQRPACEAGALRGLRRIAWAVTVLVLLMALSGGFVAGIRAGLAYNTFPLMNGHLIPPELFMLEPWHENFFNNMATVQFDHRLNSALLAVAVLLFWVKARKAVLPGRLQLVGHLLLLAVALQIGLGIATLLLVVPIPLAAAHQAGAVVVFTVALAINHALRATPATAASQASYEPA